MKEFKVLKQKFAFHKFEHTLQVNYLVTDSAQTYSCYIPINNFDELHGGKTSNFMKFINDNEIKFNPDNPTVGDLMNLISLQTIKINDSITLYEVH